MRFEVDAPQRSYARSAGAIGLGDPTTSDGNGLIDHQDDP